MDIAVAVEGKPASAMLHYPHVTGGSSHVSLYPGFAPDTDLIHQSEREQTSA
jgi:hypothetical protein